MVDARRYFDEIELGEEYESPGRTVTEADIVMFAGLSGDYNVLHTDAEFMKQTIFGERIAHGLLCLAIQSGLFTRATAPYATLGFGGLRWKFKAPVKIGDTVIVTVTVAELMPERSRARLSCVCAVGGEVVLDGEALVKVPSEAKGKRPALRL